MGNYSQAFFASPEEQVRLVLEYLSIDGAWAWMMDPQPGGDLRPLLRDSVEPSVFHGDQEDALFIFLGTSSISEEPVIQSAGARLHIDVVRSQLVQMAPAIISERVLYEGRMGIPRPEHYSDLGFDAAPVTGLFSLLRKRVRALRAPSALLVQKLSDGGVKEWKDVVVTPDTLRWRESGGLLKQFSRGPVEFDIARSQRGVNGR